MRTTNPRFSVFSGRVITAVVMLCLSDAVYSAAPGETLRRFRLSRAPNTTVWLTPDEVRFRELAAEMSGRLRTVQLMQKQINTRIQNNTQQWRTIQPLLEAVRMQADKFSADDPRRMELEQQIQRLSAEAVEPRELGAEPQVRLALIELGQRNHQVIIAIHWMQEAVARITTRYEELQGETLVNEALAKLGPNHRLGPLQSDFDEKLQRAREVEKQVLESWVPLYVSSGQQRVSGIVNQRVPGTFTWKSSGSDVWLSRSLARLAGLELNSHAATSNLRIAGRDLVAIRATLPYLQFGDCTLRDLTVNVLPPEAEDLGSFIGPDAFPNHDVVAAPEKLRLLLKAP